MVLGPKPPREKYSLFPTQHQFGHILRGHLAAEAKNCRLQPTLQALRLKLGSLIPSAGFTMRRIRRSLVCQILLAGPCSGCYICPCDCLLLLLCAQQAAPTRPRRKVCNMRKSRGIRTSMSSEYTSTLSLLTQLSVYLQLFFAHRDHRHCSLDAETFGCTR